MKNHVSFKGVCNFQIAACALALLGLQAESSAQPTLVDPNLAVREVVTNLNQPTGMAFLGANDFLVLEKPSGRVLRVVNGTVTATVLDLAVNSASERGLLSIALHPQFPAVPWVYLYWTESSTGADSGQVADVPLLGNRVDRFEWNGATLTHDAEIIRLRSFQADAGQPLRGNHNGGVVRFGPDGKLYIYIGDNGRRGQMQNLPDGPGPQGNQPDDQFGGPEPDDAHLTGVILRLNDDGSTPVDNPFYVAGELRGGAAGAGLQKVYAYGIRNGFGMAFDPRSGRLWEAQNGDDTYTEINRVERGANLGWVRVQGPLARVTDFRAIETSSNFFGLQQVRWSPTNIVDSAQGTFDRLFTVYEGGDQFAAELSASEEVPVNASTGGAVVRLMLNQDGTLSYELRATAPIQNATQAHIHLGARDQNGPVVLFLFGLVAPQNFNAGDLISTGTVADTNVIARPGFTPSIQELVSRMRQGRAYANLHTTSFPGGEIRGQVKVTDEPPVSHYTDPEFAWRFEVAPAGIGFIDSLELAPHYRGDLIVGAARDFLQGGTLFRFKLTANRRHLALEDPRLADRVADNLAKFDITESESLLFGTGFGIGTDIKTGPNGNLYVVSLTSGKVYEIYRAVHPGRQGKGNAFGHDAAHHSEETDGTATE